MHDDTDTDDFAEGSPRQERRMAERRLVRRAEEVVARLLGLTESEALELPLHDAVRRSVEEYYRIPSRGTGVRARHRLQDRLIREVRLSNLDELEFALGLGEAARSAKDDAMIALEGWRARLLEEGDAVVDELVDAYPTLDRQQLRQLVRQANKDGGRGKSYKKLFGLLREAFEV